MTKVDVEVLADVAEDVAEILRENDTPQEQRKAFVGFVEGAAAAGVVSAGEVLYALLGGHFDLKVWSASASGAFVTGVLRYVRDWRKNRAAK